MSIGLIIMLKKVYEVVSVCLIYFSKAKIQLNYFVFYTQKKMTSGPTIR